jgi:hypothetical protein
MSSDAIHAAMSTWAAKDLPARLHAAQVAKILNCTTDDVAILASAGKLRALGRPRPNAVKLFSTIELFTLLADREWLDEATKTIGHYWRRKNERRKVRDDEPEATDENQPSPPEFRAKKPSPKSSTKPSTISSTTVLKPCSERVTGDSGRIVGEDA